MTNHTITDRDSAVIAANAAKDVANLVARTEHDYGVKIDAVDVAMLMGQLLAGIITWRDIERQVIFRAGLALELQRLKALSA